MFMNTQQQGEVYVRKIDALPNGLTPFAADGGRYIISHSESGHHHVIPAGAADVMERPADPTRPGLRILYAIVKEPTTLSQTAATPHEAAHLDPGIYEMRVSREFDPVSQQARRVAD